MSKLLSVQEVAALAAKNKPVFRVPWRPALQQYALLYPAAVSGCTLADPCMLAALVARESSGQNILQKGMAPGPNCGVGICQITYGVDWSDPQVPRYQGYGDLLVPSVNLRVAAHLFLEPALEQFPDNHVAAFAAFNLGKDEVAKELAEGISPDAWTTGGDYGHAVFTDWINFAAVSLGVNVAWADWEGAKAA